MLNLVERGASVQCGCARARFSFPRSYPQDDHSLNFGIMSGLLIRELTETWNDVSQSSSTTEFLTGSWYCQL